MIYMYKGHWVLQQICNIYNFDLESKKIKILETPHANKWHVISYATKSLVTCFKVSIILKLL